jgi:hypothetical protein
MAVCMVKQSHESYAPPLDLSNFWIPAGWSSDRGLDQVVLLIIGGEDGAVQCLPQCGQVTFGEVFDVLIHGEKRTTTWRMRR